MLQTYALNPRSAAARAVLGCCCAARATPMQTSPCMPRSSRPMRWPRARAPACAPARLSWRQVRCAARCPWSWRRRSGGGWRRSCAGATGACRGAVSVCLAAWQCACTSCNNNATAGILDWQLCSGWFSEHLVILGNSQSSLHSKRVACSCASAARARRRRPAARAYSAALPGTQASWPARNVAACCPSALPAVCTLRGLLRVHEPLTH